jgi:hypothetical protein
VAYERNSSQQFIFRERNGAAQRRAQRKFGHVERNAACGLAANCLFAWAHNARKTIGYWSLSHSPASQTEHLSGSAHCQRGASPLLTLSLAKHAARTTKVREPPLCFWQNTVHIRNSLSLSAVERERRDISGRKKRGALAFICMGRISSWDGLLVEFHPRGKGAPNASRKCGAQHV